MLNRNSKKLPKEDILAIKKTGKRLRNGYALTKLKRWKKEYAERKLRSTTATEEPKKTYALKTERMKRAKVTIARRKRSKAMQERREYWRKKKVSGEKKGVKGEKKVISSGRAMPTKQAISKVKVGEKRVSGEKKGVKGEKRAISSGRAMPIQNRAMVNKQIVEKIKKIEKPARVKDIKKPTIKEIAKESIEKIKEITQETAKENLPKVKEFAKESIEKIKEIAEETAKENLPKVKEFAKESLEKIKEIAKESAGKVIVASLPKFTDEKSDAKKLEKELKSDGRKLEKELKSATRKTDIDIEEKEYYYKIISLIYGNNKAGIGSEEVFDFREWIDTNNDFNDKPHKKDYIKLDIEDIVKTYSLTNNLNLDSITIKKYIRLLFCWYLYSDVIVAPERINNLFEHINKKYDGKLLPIPIYAENVKKKQVKPLSNLNWKTLWEITKKFRNKISPAFSNIYSDINEVVITDSYKMLVLLKHNLNNETQKKLQEKTLYDENLNIINEQFPNYLTALPDEDTADDVYINLQDEIKKCKLAIKLNKYISDISQLTYTKILGSKNKNFYYCFSYDPQFMLDILEFYEKFGIDKLYLSVQNKFDETDSKLATHQGKEFSQTRRAVIITPVRVTKPELQKFVGFALLMPRFTENPVLLDTDNKNIIKELQDYSGLEDDINMSSEVQEIANDVPAFGDLFSDIDYTNEVQEIANDVPAFGDDINEEKLILDSEYYLPAVQIKRDDTAIASSKDIRVMKFKQMMLPSKYKTLLGKVPENFRLLLWGAPGHGKSSLALTIANDIGKRIKTLYVSAEESLESATLSSRIKRFKANSRNLMFNDTNNPEIIEKIIMTFNPKFIVIDSVNVMLGKAEAMINLMLKYPNIGFIIIAQATKDRKRYAGLGSLAHAVDIVVNVKDGLATAEKNRYAQLGSMAVKGIKI